MVKFMLFMSVDPSVTLSPEQKANMPAAVGAWVGEMDERGVRLQGDVLAPAGESKNVRVRDGGVLVDDGPLSESSVPITGYNILECADMDEALEVASKHPVATFGVLEVRPFAG
jgi:hypothetical protein